MPRIQKKVTTGFSQSSGSHKRSNLARKPKVRELTLEKKTRKISSVQKKELGRESDVKKSVKLQNDVLFHKNKTQNHQAIKDDDEHKSPNSSKKNKKVDAKDASLTLKRTAHIAGDKGIKKTIRKKFKEQCRNFIKEEKEDLYKAANPIKKVLIIGRPNVGKSTLYNKFLKKQTAITYNTPGVTRDILEGVCRLYKTPFIIMDSAGFDTNILSSIDRINYAIKHADIILFVTEHDVTEDDIMIANWIRKNIIVPVILVVNKCDRKVSGEYINTMNFKYFIVISAEHNIGIIELCNVIEETLVEASCEDDSALQKSINIAILGRPNVGKSTFANNLLNAERMLVSPIAGTTRDSVSARLKNDNGLFTIVDTAGIRKRAKVCDILETESAKKSFESIEKADVIVFMCDITIGELERQDLLIANKIINNGKPFLILANKSDQIKDIAECIKHFKKQCSNYLGHDVLVIPFSSLIDTDSTLVINYCLELWKIANTKITTSKLNNWLREAVTNHAHPFLATGKAVSFKYINQISTNPLKFLIHTNFANDINKNYKSYLKNHLSKSFALSGVPIFLYFRTSTNPYYSKSNSTKVMYQ